MVALELAGECAVLPDFKSHGRCRRADPTGCAKILSRPRVRALARKFQFEIRDWISILPPMSSSRLQARRATLDDIGALREMWEMMRYPLPELEKQLTDFQVVVDSE